MVVDIKRAIVHEHEDGRAAGTSYSKVDTNISCVLTRFRVTSFWALLRCYQYSRRVRKASQDVPGLIATAFLIENFHTWYSLSLWESEAAILNFNSNVHPHIRAASSVFGYLAKTRKGPELWSAQFDLAAVSNNLRWSGAKLSEWDPACVTEYESESA